MTTDETRMNVISFPMQRHRRRHADQAASIVRPPSYTAQEKDAHKRRVYAFLNEQLEKARSKRRSQNLPPHGATHEAER
jgi:hypothetical protein